mgnify:CR=1 FL=1
MKKVKLEGKYLKTKNKYTILLNHPKKPKRNILKSKSKHKYHFKFFIILKIFSVLVLSCIYFLERNLKLASKLNSFLSYYLMNKINHNIKVCLCVIGKNENIYAKEYVSYYKQLGYNHIYI